jgi:predicted transcriptional regulator YdeE
MSVYSQKNSFPFGQYEKSSIGLKEEVKQIIDTSLNIDLTEIPSMLEDAITQKTKAANDNLKEIKEEIYSQVTTSGCTLGSLATHCNNIKEKTNQVIDEKQKSESHLKTELKKLVNGRHEQLDLLRKSASLGVDIENEVCNQIDIAIGTQVENQEDKPSTITKQRSASFSMKNCPLPRVQKTFEHQKYYKFKIDNIALKLFEELCKE